jgi:thioredoxin reductase
MAQTQPKDRYDVVVIGGGPAGLSAALYTARQGLSTAVVAGELGGSPQWAGHIENYLGLGLISGPDMASRFRDHLSSFDVDVFSGQLVNAVVPSEGVFEAFTAAGLSVVGRSLIISSGRAPARLAVPGETELVGRGVSYCATCDAAFFRGRPVIVVGPGESAADAALQLAALDAQVMLASEEPLRAPQSLLDKLAGTASIKMLTGSHVVRILGEERVTGVALQEGEGPETELPVDAIFIETGFIPAGEFTGGLVKVNEAGEIEVGRDLMTSHPGIFAAGDVTDQLGKQVIIAAGDGARAGVAAAKWLQRQ